MESARPAQPKVPSPILSAFSREQMTTQPAKLKAPAPTHSESSKGEQLPPIQKNESVDMQEPATEAKDAGAPRFSLGKGRDAKNVDACEATCDSMPVKVPMPHGSAPLAEEEMQQKPSASEPGKKRKKKKVRLPLNELQWRTPQDIGGENYMMPFPPPACDPYWGNMQLGMDGFMNPYGGTMPYIGYVPGPFDPMGGMLPQDHFGGTGYMMPGFPYQRDFSDFPVGSSLAPPIMSRAEFEARKSDLRRRHDLEGDAKRIGSRDPEYGRNVSNDDGISSMKSEHRMMSKSKSPDHHHRHYHHRDEKESNEDRSHHYRVEKESSQDRSHRHLVKRESSLDRSRHHHHRSPYHRDERQVSPEQGHHHRRHRRTESPFCDVEPVRHVKRRSDHHSLPPSRDLEPVRKRRTIEQEDTVKDSGEDTADKKQKASVFSRISFPGETGGNKKQKVSLEGSSHLSNGYNKVHTVHYANGDLYEIKRSEEATLALDNDSSDDDERHFKRKPARYEPPPPPIEWEEDVRPSRS
ncbi:DWNN domain, A CCHC-type zinc finger protein [Thalictrum thalictroides]|uniref:DWNN domain, A CCHC-type zinc finger protein n=1 Tax=Thalictrum thalictroides TaxID=46969 RepID=A0A7J6WQ99_THATH|nr:DWNN domain, A CCHC-type zinc finger protein [Thalictrum thalictroides]